MKRNKSRTIRLAVALGIMAFTAACVLGALDAPWFLPVQPGPLWVRLAGGSAVAAGVTLMLVLAAATVLFGRVFCAGLCPLGTCQDIVDTFRPNRKTALPNLRLLRYGIAAVALLFVAGGWAIVFRFLDPFSRFGAIAAALEKSAAGNGSGIAFATLLSGLTPLLLLVALVVWKRRIYCTALCPVGTVLGVIAKYCVWQMRIGTSCSRCGLCASACPTGCIDSAAQTIDPERCVLCLNCTAVCPKSCITYASGPARARGTSAPDGAAADGSRRRFLLAGAAITFGVAGAGRVLSSVIQALANAGESVRGLILPPGAIGSDRFARQCTGCQVCVANCPAAIITPSPSGFGPVRIDYSHNGCAYDCTRCNAVCPTGALQPLGLVDKQWLKIGEARVDLPLCRNVKDGIACSLCEQACPKDAIIMVDGPGELQVPEVAGFHCIGCGVCRAVCPVRPKAIAVDAMEQAPMGS